MTIASVVITAVVVVAGCAGALPPRFGALAALALSGGLLVVWSVVAFPGPARSPTGVVLPPLCAFLAVALVRALLRERAAHRRLRTSVAARARAECESAAMAERARIATDVHDVIAHSITGLLMQVMAIRTVLTDSPPDFDRAEAMLDRAVEVARLALREAQGVTAADLPAPTCDDIRRVAEDFALTSGIACIVEVPGDDPAMSAVARWALYRTVQEALTNAARHSGCDQVQVSVHVGDDEVRASIEDRVRPGAPDRPAPPGQSGGQGLRGLRRRASAAGGTFVAGPTSAGFVVRLALPVSPQ